MPENDHLPCFSAVDLEKVPDELEAILTKNRAEIAELLQHPCPDWNNLFQPLEALNDTLHQYWSRINHLNAVVNSTQLREVYNLCLPKLSNYYTELSHNGKLYRAALLISESPQFASLDKAQQKTITNALRDFKLSGVALPPAQKKEFAELVTALDQLATKFEENLLDATNQWSKLVTESSMMAGIPETARHQARERASAERRDGWLLTLDIPCYLAVMRYADCRALREEMYRAYVTRASDLWKDKALDNTVIIEEILCKRLALAKLLGFENYAQQSLATKMADSPQQVLQFLDQLADAAHKQAEQEYEALINFVDGQFGLELQPWDIVYYSEKLQQKCHAISCEALRPYFAAEHVISGLFAIVKRLFAIDIRLLENVDVWHRDVRCYALYNNTGECIGHCYFDLYARPKKRGGAWMDDCRGRRRRDDGSIQRPIAFVTCNFGSATETAPALFTHDEVLTLFHEFGHALQHLLTTVDCVSVSGLNGIPWDAVELASQFLENWAWHREPLHLFARHYQTGELLPDVLYQKMFAARNFQSALQMLRQVELSLFDFLLHLDLAPEKKGQVQAILDGVRKKVAVLPAPSYSRLQHSFSHIFAGGYAAGYYSYKWAEVMASDAFGLFLEKGIFDQSSAQRFLRCILQPGGSEDPSVLYRQYRGRAPVIDSLLQQSGIAA